MRKWEALGFRVREGASLRSRHRYFAGTDDARAADFNAMLRAADVSAIVCARGGYGAMRLAPRIDWDAARARPRVFLGFSDIAFLHCAFLRETGQVVLHAPMAANAAFLNQTPERDRLLLDFLTDPDARPVISDAGAGSLRPGRASGPLVGGCLSLVHATLGTPWEIETDGRVLFLEDHREAAYRIDRMLTHLKLAGKLDGIVGLALGDLGIPIAEASSIVGELLGDREVPVVHGLPVGHGPVNLPLALGARVEIDAALPGLGFLEGAVA
jgi:muramoyltetrapeptide carboxypeptidase